MTIIDDHVKALKEMEGYTVEAGWFASARYKAGKRVNPKMVGVPVARIARINEFGAKIKHSGGKTTVIPARPFMRLAVQNFKAARIDKQAAIARQMLSGKIKPEQAMAQIGLVMENCIVDSIKNGKWEPIAESTRKRKGFPTPLIDTGQMWQAVTSKVVKST
jgi:hypothetical protein